MSDLKTSGAYAASTPVGPGLASQAFQIITAISMTVGRGPLARAIADAARLAPGDRVIDTGCGPGTAVRQAARRAAAVTGIDPSPSCCAWPAGSPGSAGCRTSTGSRAGRRNCRCPTARRPWHGRSTPFITGTTAPAGLSEARRVLAAGGRLVLAERLTRPGARGHAAHGLTGNQADDLAGQLAAAGFVEVRAEARSAGRRNLVIVRGRKGSASGSGPRLTAGA